MNRKENTKHAEVRKRERTLDEKQEQEETVTEQTIDRAEQKTSDTSKVTSFKDGDKTRYFKAIILVALAIVILAFFANTKDVIEKVEYIKNVITGKLLHIKIYYILFITSSSIITYHWVIFAPYR